MFKRLSIITTAGFAVFSMFFGSGNLVFPLLVGKQSQSSYGLAMLGLMVTGIFVPLLGMLSLLAHGKPGKSARGAEGEGTVWTYMNTLGRRPAWLLMFVILGLLGPFGVCPRCILVAYGGLKPLYPQLSLSLFAFLFCGLVGFMAWRPQAIIDWIGKGLTPFLLAGLSCLVFFGVRGPTPEGVLEAQEAFSLGFFKGYETMDLLAAFFFSGVVVEYMRAQAQGSKRQLLVLSLGASVLGALLLGLVYWGLVALGAKHALVLEGVHPSSFLVTVAQETLGSWALPVVGVTIALACLTTMLILVQLFAQFVIDSFPKRRSLGHSALLGTLVLCFIQAHLQFDRLEVFLAKILQVAYPALIIFALAMLWDRFRGTHVSAKAFWIAVFASSAHLFYA